MKENFVSLSEDELTEIVGGHRHRYYHDGYETGRAVRAIGTVAHIIGEVGDLLGD